MTSFYAVDARQSAQWLSAADFVHDPNGDRLNRNSQDFDADVAAACLLGWVDGTDVKRGPDACGAVAQSQQRSEPHQTSGASESVRRNRSAEEGSQVFTLYGRNVRRAALQGVNAERDVNSATSKHTRLNRAIEAARSTEELLAVVEAHWEDFDAFHHVLVVHRLAKSGRLSGAKAVLRHPRWPALLQKVTEVVRIAEPRQLASVVWAMANLRCIDRPLLEGVANRCISRDSGSSWDAMSLSLVPQSFAMLHARHEELLTSIAAEVKRSTSAVWGPSDLGRLAWAIAKLLKRDDAFFRDASCKLLSRLHECAPTIISQCVWAFATIAPKETAEAHFFPRVAEAMRGPALSDYAPAHLAMITWSFAAVLFRPVELLDEIGEIMPPMADRLNPQDISMTAWSYATLLAPQRRIFATLADAAIRSVGLFNPQDLSNTAWAFATAGEYCAPMLDAIGDEACRRPGQFSYQHTSMLLWSFVTLKHPHEALFKLCGEIAEVDQSSWSSAKLIAYALGGLPRLGATLGSQAATFRLASGLVAALQERNRQGLGEPDDASTVHDAVFPWIQAALLPGSSERALMESSSWQEVEALVDAQRRRVVALLGQASFNAVLPDPGDVELSYNVGVVRDYQASVQALGLRGLGSLHTWRLLAEFGAERMSPELAQKAAEALHRAESQRAGDGNPGRGERANRCFWQASIRAPGPSGVERAVEEPGRVLNSTVVTYREENAGLVAVKLSHDRVSHRAWDCEFRAMARTASASRALLRGLKLTRVNSLLEVGSLEGVAVTGEEELDEEQHRLHWHGERAVEGCLKIYMTEVPCLSCVCAMLQFRRRFPNIQLEVDWAGAPSIAYDPH